jgi:FtsP/CotA-like multicopper oxidase with cupredoxin domain
LAPRLPQAQAAAPTVLQTVTRSLDINGKSATMMGIHQSTGNAGLNLSVDQPFNILLENKLSVPTALHWHGLHPPNNQDGVPGLTQPVIQPNASFAYDFRTVPAGTHWLHSHEGLQEAFLLSAPLIVHGADEPADEQQIIIFLGDFSFTPPAEILQRLRKGPAKPMAPAMSGTTTSAKAGAMSGGMDKPDANDVNYDAYLANDRTLADPQVTRVEKNARIRLRIINGSSGTNFFVNLGELSGALIATDGMPVEEIRGSRFPLAVAQRIDVRIQIPSDGVFPILAERELAREQAGIILATPGATVKKVPQVRASAAGLLTPELESQLRAASPLATKPIDQSYELRLGGNMAKYQWPINGTIFDVAKPSSEPAAVRVKVGQRVAVKFVNETPMAHPMHLHGHSFQVIDIDGKPQSGALRDTILVPPKQSVTVAFDANNPGTWYVHCHILWHLAAGMAALVQYES